MAVIITDSGTPTGTFRVDGVLYNKIFQPMPAGGSSVALYNTFDTRFRLLKPTAVSEVEVNGTTYLTQLELVNALLPVVYSSAVETGGGASSWGDITGSLVNQTDLQAALNGKQDAGAFAAWADITGKPTTVSGFGITDVYTKATTDSKYAILSHTHSTSEISNLSSYTGFDSKYLGKTETAANSEKIAGFTYSNLSTPSTLVLRDSAGDVNARLFRSEYDTTNASVNFIMTQVDTAANNYIRPTTPAQFRAGVTAGHYLPIGGKAADSNLLDGLDSTAFLLAGGKAADSNLLDGLDSTQFLRSDGTAVNSNLLGGVASDIEPSFSTIVRRANTGAIRAHAFESTNTTVDTNYFYIMTQVGQASNNNKLQPVTFDQFRTRVTDGYYFGSGTINVQKSQYTRYNDGTAIFFGDGNDFEVTHSGTDTYMNMWAGNLYLRSGVNNRFTFFKASGDLTATGVMTADNFILGSDKRYKDNIQDVQETDIAVDWKTFTMKKDSTQLRYGVVAQELEKVHPEFIRTSPEGFKSVAYIDLLIAKIAELERKINN